MKRIITILCVLAYTVSLSAQLDKLKPLKGDERFWTFVPVEKKGKWGYGYKREGKDPKVVIKHIFDEAYDFVDSVAIVKYGGRYGMLHKTGVMAVEPIYDETTGFVNNLCCCRLNSDYIVLNSELKEVCKWTMKNSNTYSFFINGTPFNVKLVKKGKFSMGMKSSDSELFYDAPMHDVEITNDYYIGETEVTAQVYAAVMYGTTFYDNPACTIKSEITWDECISFVERLTKFFPCFEFRVPSEAEWEFAARSLCKIQSSNTSENSSLLSTFTQNPQRTDSEIVNMTNNVEEWCYDWYNSDYYNVCPLYDPAGPPSGKGRVVRGVDWSVLPESLRIAYRSSHAPGYKSKKLGLRVVMNKKFDIENGTLKENADFLEHLSTCLSGQAH